MALDDKERELLKAILSRPLFLPNDFKGWMVDFLVTNIPNIPIKHVYGYSITTGRVASRVDTEETTTSTAYTDLATVGPQLTGLSDGRYMLIFGCKTHTADTMDYFMSPSINGSTPSDDNAAEGSRGTAIGRAIVLTVDNGTDNNTVVMKYRVASGTGDFSKRWLAAFKVLRA